MFKWRYDMSKNVKERIKRAFYKRTRKKNPGITDIEIRKRWEAREEKEGKEGGEGK